jgi:hypothetical protein
VEEAEVGGLVPGEDAVAPAPAAVHVREGFAEGEDGVVAREVEGADGVGVRHRAVVGVVEQEREAGAARAGAADRGDEGGVVPFVDDHGVRAVEGGFGVLGASKGVEVRSG